MNLFNEDYLDNVFDERMLSLTSHKSAGVIYSCLSIPRCKSLPFALISDFCNSIKYKWNQFNKENYSPKWI